MVTLNTGIDPKDVTALIITRGDVPELMAEREAQYERLGFASCLIIKSPDVLTRWTSAERHVHTKAVFFQDDDVALADDDILAILGKYKPGVMIASMYDGWIEGMQYFDLALFGLGSVMDVGLWREPIARWTAAYPGAKDHLDWDADFIVGVLGRWERYDFNGEDAILPEASADNRLWRTPGQHERKYETIRMARDLRTMTGAVMALNEEDNIAAAIESVAPMVSSITLLDTGSTDRTIEVAGHTCDALDLEFHVYEAPFVDMATTRNVLLEAARGHGDYFLMFDADEVWLGDKALPPLSLDVMIVNYAGTIQYGHPRIVNRNFPCWFEGKVHAALAWERDARGMTLEGLTIDHRGDLTHGNIEERLRKDVRLLTEEIDAGNDVPHNTFMRAKAYEGLGDWEAARKDYEARLEHEDNPNDGGIPAEQRYYSRFRLGVLLVEKFGLFDQGADHLYSAWMDRRTRVETIRALARYLNAVADATPIPETDMLFVHRDEYNTTPKEG